jgi:hypothetical protein
MLRADPLSRRPDHEEGVKTNNLDCMVLKPKFFAIKAMFTSHLAVVQDNDVILRIKSALENNTMTKSYRHLLTLGAREFKKSLQEWNFGKGLLLHHSKIYVPKDQDIRLELL